MFRCLPVEFLSLLMGRREGGRDFPVHSQLAALDSLHASGLHLPCHVGTLCRDAQKGMHGTELWAALKAKGPSLLGRVRRTCVPRHSSTPQRQARLVRREFLPCRVGLRDRPPPWEHSRTCTWALHTLTPACVSAIRFCLSRVWPH